MKRILLLAGIMAAWAPLSYAAEFTLKTMYPVPSGRFMTLEATTMKLSNSDAASLAATCIPGTMTYDSLNHLYKSCQYNPTDPGNGAWGLLLGVWMQQGNQISPADSTNPNIKIAIA